MGLDITVYSNLQSLGKHTEKWCYEEDHIMAYAYDSFPKSFDGIPILEIFNSGESIFLHGGCFIPTEETEKYYFPAGAYHNYNIWRSDLARQFNPQRKEKVEGHFGFYPSKPDVEKPFYELIWFADNCGCIGPLAAQRLFNDFKENEDKYQSLTDINGFNYNKEKYQHWMKACEVASQSGLIDFH
jgi:hypothetical protein